MSLEKVLQKSGETLSWYGNAIKDNYKQFIPSLFVSVMQEHPVEF